MSIQQKNVIFLNRDENQSGPSPSCYKVLRKSDINTFKDYLWDFTKEIISILSERLAYNHIGIIAGG